MSFTETQFPVDISYGSAGGPEFSTDILITHSGHEQRNSNWSQARLRYNVAYGVKTKEQLSSLIAFFRARKGQAEGFRFKDWTDFEATNQPLGTGDGSITQFQLVKHYTSGTAAHSRTITKPVESTVKIYLDDVLQTSGYSLDTTTGIITFDSPPANSAELKTDFAFDTPVRFATDALSSSLDDYGVYSARNIALLEIRV